MATGTNGIATSKDLYNKFGGTLIPNLDSCPTCNTIKTSYKLDVSGSYEDDQLVRYSDVKASSSATFKTGRSIGLTINKLVIEIYTSSTGGTPIWTDQGTEVSVPVGSYQNRYLNITPQYTLVNIGTATFTCSTNSGTVNINNLTRYLISSYWSVNGTYTVTGTALGDITEGPTLG